MQPASEQSDNAVVGTCLENVHQSHDKGMVRAVKSLWQWPKASEKSKKAQDMETIICPPLPFENYETYMATTCASNVQWLILCVSSSNQQPYQACASRTAYLVVRSCQTNQIYDQSWPALLSASMEPQDTSRAQTTTTHLFGEFVPWKVQLSFGCSFMA